MQQVKTLSLQQKEKIPFYFKKWDEKSADIKPVNKPAVELAICNLYRQHPHKYPVPKFHWVASPILALRENLHDETGDQSLASIFRWPVMLRYCEGLSNLKRHVSARTRGELREALRKPLSRRTLKRCWIKEDNCPAGPQIAQMINLTGDRLLDVAFAEVTRKRYEKTRDYKDQSIWSNIDSRESAGLGFGRSDFGQNGKSATQLFLNTGEDSAALAYFDFLSSVCGLTHGLRYIRPFLDLAEHASWVLPHRNECWCVERPTKIVTDAKGRLHCCDGPSVAYGETTEFYFWHGVDVPEHAIRDQNSIDLPRICSEPNVERRRTLIQLMGVVRFIRDSGALLVDEDDDARLWQSCLKMSCDRGWVWAALEFKDLDKLRNSSEEYNYFRVPTHLTTVSSAMRWKFGSNFQDTV